MKTVSANQQTARKCLSPLLSILLLFQLSPSLKAQTMPWNTNGSNIYNPNTGNVGIGTTTPSSQLTINAATSGDGGTSNGTGSALYVKQNSTWGINQPWALYVSGYSYLNGLRINAADGQRGIHKVTAGGQLGFSTQGDDPITFTQNAENERMRIAAGGNVGIGTTTPAYNLDVSGSTRATSYLVDAGQSAYSGDYQFRSAGTYRGRFIWYSNTYSGSPSNSITVENPAGAPIASFYENGNTAFGGNVAIGTTNDHGYKLAVNGNILAQKLRITQTGWPDYVFQKTYKLPSLQEVENFININQHLPDVPSTSEVEKNGLDVGENQAVLLKKIEELTLYVIQQQKQIEELRSELQITNRCIMSK